MRKPTVHPLLQGRLAEVKLMLGNEAIARGALEAGVAFAAAYPGTPSSEIALQFFSDLTQERPLLRIQRQRKSRS